MSISILNIAKQIASKLDSTDKAGRNNKIDKDKWNAFAQGKGNSIKKYIDVNTAAKSISIYLRREAKKSSQNISEIGNNWLAQLDGVYTKEVVLDEVIITSNKPQNKPPVIQNKPAVEDNHELASNPLSKPEETPAQPTQEVVTREIPAERISYIETTNQPRIAMITDITPTYNELFGISDEPVSSPVIEDYEPTESDQEEILNNISKTYDMRAEFMIAARYTMYAIRSKLNSANVSNELYEKIIQSVL